MRSPEMAQAFDHEVAVMQRLMLMREEVSGTVRPSNTMAR
jgi:hypothetical protein